MYSTWPDLGPGAPGAANALEQITHIAMLTKNLMVVSFGQVASSERTQGIRFCVDGGRLLRRGSEAWRNRQDNFIVCGQCAQ